MTCWGISHEWVCVCGFGFTSLLSGWIPANWPHFFGLPSWNIHVQQRQRVCLRRPQPVWFSECVCGDESFVSPLFMCVFLFVLCAHTVHYMATFSYTAHSVGHLWKCFGGRAVRDACFTDHSQISDSHIRSQVVTLHCGIHTACNHRGETVEPWS